MRMLPATLAVACLTLALLALPSAAADGAGAPCTGPNEYVVEDVRDTLSGDVQCGSLTDPCFADGSRCWGCGPDVVEWLIGPIYCV